MIDAMRAAFWLSAAVLFYAYAGFPLLLMAVALLRRRAGRVERRPLTPRMSLVIAAYNEEAAIADRLDNALAVDYPPGSLEIIVASDGSSDATEAIVSRYASERVRLLRCPRRGKVAALDAAVREATGEVLVFSDANTHLEPGALRALAANFADPAVGGVVGHTGYRLEAGSDSGSRGERLYWRYDTWLKELESRTGSVVSAHGGLYALRRELYRRPEDPAVTDDFAISTAVVEQGRRLVFERGARAWEAAVPAAELEFRRRVRLMTRGLRAVALRRALLNPLRHGFYAIALFSHKVLRRVAALPLLVLAAAGIALAPEGGIYLGAAICLAALLLLGGLGFALRRTAAGRWPVLYVPFYYGLANAAALVALARFVRGDAIERWEPQRHGVAAG